MPGPENTNAIELPEGALEAAGRILEGLGENASDSAVMRVLESTGTGITGVTETVPDQPEPPKDITNLQIPVVSE